MINRIFIIGDSFCDGVMHSKDSNIASDTIHWVNYLDWHYEDVEVINDALGSRDFQSVIDCWIKLFPILTENDRVIIGFPDTQRQRIPIKDENNYRKITWSGGVLKNMFLTRQWWRVFGDFKKTVAHDFFKNENVKYTEQSIDEILFFFEIINQSRTTALNYKEVVEALYKVAPCKTYLFTWHDHKLYNTPKADCVEDKNDLTKNMGIWTTQHLLWEETGGKRGGEEDYHWDYRTMEAFGKYVIEKVR